MKKAVHILISLLLSLTILFIGAGVYVVHCTHSGMVSIVLEPVESDCNGDYCGISSGCMTMELIELSPTQSVQTPVFDFHAPQLLTDFFFEMPFRSVIPVEGLLEHPYIFPIFKRPPGESLYILCKLLI